MTVIQADHVSKFYGQVIAVNDLSVDVQPGITGLLGPNGAGKSSFLRMVVGLQRPTSGTIKVLDEDPWNNTKLLRRIGYLPEGDAPWPQRTGRQAAVLAARLGGMDKGQAEQAAERSLGQVGLAGEADRPSATYSHGTRQKLKLAIALLSDPELLVLDEPLIGSDPMSRRELIELVKGLAQGGKSVLLSTHVLPDVEAMTQRILLLNHGRMMAYGDVGEIRDLLERYPRTVRVHTPQPRELGAAIWNWPTVLSLQAEENAVVVRTPKPQAFYKDLQDLLIRQSIPFTSVTSPDDNVEAVFQYLVG
jgi:ABC-2 type transport system ATP-binding protein